MHVGRVPLVTAVHTRDRPFGLAFCPAAVLSCGADELHSSVGKAVLRKALRLPLPPAHGDPHGCVVCGNRRGAEHGPFVGSTQLDGRPLSPSFEEVAPPAALSVCDHWHPEGASHWPIGLFPTVYPRQKTDNRARLSIKGGAIDGRRHCVAVAIPPSLSPRRPFSNTVATNRTCRGTPVHHYIVGNGGRACCHLLNSVLARVRCWQATAATAEDGPSRVAPSWRVGPLPPRPVLTAVVHAARPRRGPHAHHLLI